MHVIFGENYKLKSSFNNINDLGISQCQNQLSNHQIGFYCSYQTMFSTSKMTFYITVWKQCW